mmetsp:Transcript_49826/g.108327  ORF Transcript_49826/g.108327 Transcript_49826/m.108327 type:complete len:545 (+) Transcript_49826:66-1700(+)
MEFSRFIAISTSFLAFSSPSALEIASARVASLASRRTMLQRTVRNALDIPEDWQILSNSGDAQYTAALTVGGQTFNAILDSGSFDILLFSKRCTFMCGDITKLYDVDKSTTYSQGSINSQQIFGSGSTLSEEGWESISIGGDTVKEQIFWMVYDADMPILWDSSFQAIVGLGPPGSAIKLAEADALDAEEKLEALQERGSASEQDLATAQKLADHYERVVNHTKGENASGLVKNLGLETWSICLGKVYGSDGYFIWKDTLPQNEPKGVFQTVPVLNDMYWSTPLANVSLAKLPGIINDKTTPLGCHDKKCNAIFDTGTSLIMMPSSAFDMVQDALEKWRALSGNCKDLSSLPDLVFMIGDVRIRLPPESYVGDLTGDADSLRPELYEHMPHLKEAFAARDARQALLKERASGLDLDSGNSSDFSDFSEYWEDSEDLDSCAPLLMTLDMETEYGEAWLFGLPFFRSYYTSFKFDLHGNPRFPVGESISFAKTDPKCQPISHVAPEAEQFLPVMDHDSAHRVRLDVSKIRVPGWLSKTLAEKHARH